MNSFPIAIFIIVPFNDSNSEIYSLILSGEFGLPLLLKESKELKFEKLLVKL